MAHKNPLTGWGGNSLRPSDDASSAFAEQEIDPIVSDRIGGYFVSSADMHASLRLARGRILQALSERNDPTDSFIDFVIAWEGMVGSSENTSYVVSAAMSLLLSPNDIDKRKDQFTSVRKLYNNRSGLVHGTLGPGSESKSFKTTDIRDYAEQSGRFAIETFKRILSRPELMSLSAQERSRMVVLGFAVG